MKFTRHNVDTSKTFLALLFISTRVLTTLMLPFAETAQREVVGCKEHQTKGQLLVAVPVPGRPCTYSFHVHHKTAAIADNQTLRGGTNIFRRQQSPM